MFSNSSAGPFFSSTRRATAPISRSQSTEAAMRRSCPCFSSAANDSLRSMKPMRHSSLLRSSPKNQPTTRGACSSAESGSDLFKREMLQVGTFLGVLDGESADLSLSVDIELSVLVEILCLGD